MRVKTHFIIGELAFNTFQKELAGEEPPKHGNGIMLRFQLISGRAMSPAPRFPTTQWSLVLSVGESLKSKETRLLSALREAHWYPLYAFICGSGHSVDNAQDLTQVFFARVIEKRYLEQADPDRGRFAVSYQPV